MKAVPAKSCPSCGERYDADVLFCPRDGTPLASTRNPSSLAANSERDPYLGIELPGQIRLDHLIGIGSMGRVYRAFQGGIERDVAVKVLHRELSGNQELVGRFHREAKVASRLVHPNVVQVLMTGALPQSTDARIGGELYLVMEFLDGISLLSALCAAGTGADGQALPLARALHVTLQICDAVGEAHAQGIVHRDLKPENVMLVRRGDDPDYVKVLDFGIARLDWADRGMATQAGLIFGTAKYISPEGAEGHPVGPPADVYSITTMLYQMLAGRTPFEGDSPVALLVQHSHAPPAELRSIARASYVPAPLAAAIMQNLSKKPGDRAANAKILGRDLIAAARAGGLFPEEIAAPSMFSPASLGAVKLASKERTRAHELSAELAAKIGGVAAVADGRERARGTEDARGPTPTLPSAVAASPAPRALTPVDNTRAALRADAPVPPPLPVTVSATVQDDTVGSDEVEGPIPSTARGRDDARPASNAPPAAPRAAASSGTSRVGPAELDFDDDGLPRPVEGPGGTLPGTPIPGPLSTMQGTETSVDEPLYPGGPRPRRARMARLAVIVACALVATPIVILGGRRLGGFGATAPGDSVEQSLEEARDAMRRHAWDAPPGHNFKEITDAALVRWPDNAALLDLRREAAERLVTEALGRKYGNDIPEATRLVKLSLQLNPQLTTAQHLAADLEGPRSPDVAPASSGAATSSDRGSRVPRRARDVRPVEPRVPQPTPPVAPTASGAVLPPPQAPKAPDHGPPPTPSSTGPWL